MGTYTGGCQCGAVRPAVEASPEGAITCYCPDGINPPRHRHDGAARRREVGMRIIWLALALAATPLAARAECATAQTQAEMTQCAYLGWQAADAALNLAYDRAQDAVKGIDRDLPERFRGAEDALLTAQRAWILVRDESCKAQAWVAKGGTAEAMINYSCMARLSQERADFLRGMAEGF
jgi:uncharacterized protein YecT (DUF1311 family)